MSSPALAQSILQTIAYFDIAHFPLTKEEVWRYAWAARPAYGEMETTLNQLVQTKQLESGYGYFFLPGKMPDIESRRRSTSVSDYKLKRAERITRLLRSVPYLRAIFLSSSVAAETATPGSDIDFFIVTEPQRIWLVRFFTNLILRLFGLRVYGEKKKDRACLCFFVDTNHLNLFPLKVADDDIHFAYWLNQMVPLYDQQDYFQQFMAANSWTKQLLPNIELSFRPTRLGGERRNLATVAQRDFSTTARSSARNDSKAALTKLENLWKKAWETMWRGSYGDIIEGQFKAVQLMKMTFSLKQKAELNNHEVVIADGVIKLHDKDARRWYREEWVKKCRVINDRR